MGMFKAILTEIAETAMIANAPRNTDFYYCRNCRQEFPVDDAEVKLTFAGSLEEPPEYEDRCPHCYSNSLTETVKAWCANCEDELVADPDQWCAECLAGAEEMERDRFYDR